MIPGVRTLRHGFIEILGSQGQAITLAPGEALVLADTVSQHVHDFHSVAGQSRTADGAASADQCDGLRARIGDTHA